MRDPSEATAHVDDDFLLDLAHGLIDSGAAVGGEATVRPDPRLDHLRACVSCDRRFREQMGIRERLRAAGLPGNGDVGTAEDSVRALRPSGEKMTGFARTRVVAALIAAAALVALLTVPLVLRRHDPGLPDYWLPLDRGELSTRAGSSDPIADLRLAFRKYEQRDAAGALELLERADLPESHRPLRDLFEASALLHLDRAEQARALLETIPIVSMPEPWRDRASWLLYESLVRTGDREGAETHLAALAVLPGDIGDLARAQRDREGSASR